MTNKELFDYLKDVSERYVLLRGLFDVTKRDGKFYGDITDESYLSKVGRWPEIELVKDAFEEYDLSVDAEGTYDYEVLMCYTEEQRGNYPPPNLECNAYYTIEHIELKPL